MHRILAKSRRMLIVALVAGAAGGLYTGGFWHGYFDGWGDGFLSGTVDYKRQRLEVIEEEMDKAKRERPTEDGISQ